MMTARRTAIVAALAALTLSACATPVAPARMVPDRPAFEGKALSAEMLGRIAVGEVGGGQETNPLDVSKVGNAELREALRLSLARYGLLSREEAAARFYLDAFLVVLKQPRGGLDLSVHAFVRYRLTRIADGGLVLDDIFDGSYTARTSDSLVASRRLKIANEGAVRQSIAALLERLVGVPASDLSTGRAGEGPAPGGVLL